MPRFAPDFNNISDWDFCTLCNRYDTIMNYIPVTKERFCRVCDNCLAKYPIEELKEKLRIKYNL